MSLPPAVHRVADRMRRVRLTRRGTVIAVVGAVCGAGAYGLGFPELLYPAALGLLLPVAALVTLTASRVDIDVDRRFGPAVGAVGSPVMVEVTVTNRRGTDHSAPRLVGQAS